MLKITLFILLLAKGIGYSYDSEDLSSNPECCPCKKLDSTSRHSINIAPLSLVNKTLNLHYQYQIKSKHGVALSVKYKTGASSAYHGTISYRKHLKPSMQSFFWGPFLGWYYLEDLKIELEENSERKKFKYHIEGWRAGLNMGKRWVLFKKLNLVGRFGWGVTSKDITWLGDEPEENIDELLSIIHGFDAELSLGYMF